MFAAILTILFTRDLVVPPKQPDLGFEWHSTDLRGANEIHISPIYFRERPRWIRLYGIDVPNASQRGYSGARQDLELILGRVADVHFEDENEKHPVSRNATCVQYLWTRGKLIQFELVRDGWAKVNDEGRKGRYAKFLIGAEAEAKRFHNGLWGLQP